MAYANISFTGGTFAETCTTQPNRNRRSVLVLQCATPTSCVLDPGALTCAFPLVAEAPPCFYQGTLFVDCSRNVFNTGSLCVDLPSPTASGTPTLSPTSSLSVGASPSGSPSNTPSTSSTGSQTPSASGTASNTPSRPPTPTASASLVPQPAWLVSSLIGQDLGVAMPGNVQYTFRPFLNVFQGGISIGARYAGFLTVPDASCATGVRYARQVFDSGDVCGTTGRPRDASVTFACDANSTTVPRLLNNVLEAPTCTFSLTLALPCGGNPDFPGTLCTQPTPSPTASVTASQSASPESTPKRTETPTAGSSASNSASASATPPPTASNTGSASVTPSATTSPLSTLPFKARITIGANYLNFLSSLSFRTPAECSPRVPRAQRRP